MEHPGDQQADRLGPQDHSTVPTATGCAAGVRAEARAGQQARSVQALSGKTDVRWGMERVRPAAGAARTELQRWIHDSEGLVAAAAISKRRKHWLKRRTRLSSPVKKQDPTQKSPELATKHTAWHSLTFGHVHLGQALGECVLARGMQ